MIFLKTLLQILLQFCHRWGNYVKSQIPTSYFRNYLWWKVIRAYVKWVMASFHCYGKSEFGEMYPIWNFHLSLVRHLSLIFCWTDNGGALVAQSWMVSLLKNPIEPPKKLIYLNLQVCGECFSVFNRYLGEEQYTPIGSLHFAKNRLFAQFHASYP